MLLFQCRKQFPVILGTLLLVLIALTACQSMPEAQPTPTPNILSTVVSEQLTKVVFLVTSTPDAANPDQSAKTVTPTSTNDEFALPGVAAANGIQISLEQVVETESGYILKGKISKVPGLWLMVLPGEGTQLLDSKGGVIPTKYYSEGKGGTIQDTFADWGLQTIGKDFPGPWKLTIPSLFVELSRKVSFTVDLGSSPQAGQSGELNIPLDFAGFKFVVEKVERIQSKDGRPCLSFLFATGPEILRISGVTDPGNTSRHTNMHVSDAIQGRSTNSLCYDQAPAGIHSFDIYMLEVIQPGPWLLGWQPSNSSAN